MRTVKSFLYIKSYTIFSVYVYRCVCVWPESTINTPRFVIFDWNLMGNKKISYLFNILIQRWGEGKCSKKMRNIIVEKTCEREKIVLRYWWFWFVSIPITIDWTLLVFTWVTTLLHYTAIVGLTEIKCVYVLNASSLLKKIFINVKIIDFLFEQIRFLRQFDMYAY